VWQFGDDLQAQANMVNGGVQERTLLMDGMGSVRQATNLSGSMTDAFEYDAFGEELSRTGVSNIDHRFRGEQLDPNSGFYNLRARWYEAGIGRFSSIDGALGASDSPLSLHKYNFTHSDPVNNLDPSGFSNLAENMVTVNFEANLSVASLSTVTVDTSLVAANDALWATAGADAAVATSSSTSLLEVLALTAAANEVDRYLGVPVIVFGREFPEHALHIGEAELGLGSNFRPISPALNRFPLWSRGWYNKTSECDEIARGLAGNTKACDEYPFGTTRQGGPANYALWGVSLRLVSLDESSATGGFLNSFYGTAMISPDGLSPASRFLALGIPGARSFYTDRLGRVHYWN
jgi:RHS repeat-associated protein